MSTRQRTTSYANFAEVLAEVATGLWRAIKEARGNCVSFTPKKILQYAGVDDNVKPIKLTLVRYILDQLVEKDVLYKDNKRYKICKYMILDDGSICQDEKNPLWELCKSTDSPDEVIKLLSQLVE